MFPLTHIECAGRLIGAATGQEKAALYLGAILPDILKPFLGWEGAHCLWRFEALREAALQSKGIENIFFQALVTHGVEPAGLDLYADRKMPGKEDGWAYLTVAPIQAEFTRVTRLSPPFDRWKSHNLAEIVIEAHVAAKDPDRGPQVKALLLSEKETVRDLAWMTARLCALEEDRVEAAVFQFFAHVFHEKVELSDYAMRFSHLLRHEQQSPVGPEDLHALLVKIKTSLRGGEDALLAALTDFAKMDLDKVREEMR